MSRTPASILQGLFDVDGPRHREQQAQRAQRLDFEVKTSKDVVFPWAMPEAQTFLDNPPTSACSTPTAVRQANHTDNVELLEIDALPGNLHRLIVQHNGLKVSPMRCLGRR